MSAAKAATITETYDFTASGFGIGTGSPVDPWTGSFTITFDPTQSGSIGPLTLDAFKSNLPASYDPFVYSQSSNLVFIGDSCNLGGCSATNGVDNAVFDFFADASGNPSGIDALITSIRSPSSLFEAANFSVTLAPAGAPGPIAGAGLPGVLAMLVGGLMWWRRKLTFSLMP